MPLSKARDASHMLLQPSAAAAAAAPHAGRRLCAAATARGHGRLCAAATAGGHRRRRLPAPAATAGVDAPTRAALVTGAYATVAGLALCAAPRSVLGLLFAEAATLPRGWIRVGGVLFACFGLQYLLAGLASARGWWGLQADVGGDASRTARAFYAASIPSRLFLAAAFAAVVAAGEVGPALLLLSALNAVGAAAMWRALRSTELETS